MYIEPKLQILLSLMRILEATGEILKFYDLWKTGRTGKSYLRHQIMIFVFFFTFCYQILCLWLRSRGISLFFLLSPFPIAISKLLSLWLFFFFFFALNIKLIDYPDGTKWPNDVSVLMRKASGCLWCGRAWPPPTASRHVRLSPL